MTSQLTARHLENLIRCLSTMSDDAARAASWGRELATAFASGARLLVAGVGGSAAEAQHLAAEFVGRYAMDRGAYPALCLSCDSSTVTAIMNDYGAETVFARQVLAHGRPGDVLLCLSTSGQSPSIVAAPAVARDRGLRTWAMTGRGPNKLGELVDDCIYVNSDVVATVQEAHLVLLHVLCEGFDAAIGCLPPPGDDADRS